MDSRDTFQALIRPPRRVISHNGESVVATALVSGPAQGNVDDVL